MEELIIQDLLGQLIPKMQESGIKKVYLCTRYTESGSSTTEGNYLDEVGNIHVGLIASSKKLLREYQNQTKIDPVHRFNKVEFEVFKDGTYKASYVWDEAEFLKDKQSTAEVFPLWLNDRFHQFLFEAGYGDDLDWQNGTCIVKIIENQVKISITLYNKGKAFEAAVTFPAPVIEGILFHHQITNQGLLSGTWPKWNTLIIHTNQSSIDLDKDVEYRFEV